jgi:hypothetical protein
VKLLLAAATADLRAPDWAMPSLSPAQAVQLQELGWREFTQAFRFPGHQFRAFGRSPLDSRERAANGDLLFAAPPWVHGDFALFSGTAHPEFVRFRLGRALADPFAGHRFRHPATRWYNLASRTGMRAYFPRNAPQVLDFFAGLVALRLRAGGRPLLVAKKCFVPLCAEGLARRLAELGLPQVRLVTGDWDRVDLDAPLVVPLISYGRSSAQGGFVVVAYAARGARRTMQRRGRRLARDRFQEEAPPGLPHGGALALLSR